MKDINNSLKELSAKKTTINYLKSIYRDLNNSISINEIYNPMENEIVRDMHTLEKAIRIVIESEGE